MRLFVALVLVFLVPGLTAGLFTLVSMLVALKGLCLPLVVGVLAGLFCGTVILRRFPVVGMFFHELAHAVAALMFFRKVKGFVVTKTDGGKVCHSAGFGGSLGDDFIALAPYFLPTATIGLMLCSLVFNITQTMMFFVAIGFSLGFQGSAVVRELRINWTSERFAQVLSRKSVQTDIARCGFTYSFVFILFSVLLIWSQVLALLLHNQHGYAMWWQVVYGTTRTEIRLMTMAVNLMHEMS